LKWISETDKSETRWKIIYKLYQLMRTIHILLKHKTISETTNVTIIS
jgi:hypothetical protein